MGAKLDALVKEVNKSAKNEIFTQGLSSYNYHRIPFTSPRMNYCTFGGIPVHKITEFYGEEHGGKTTTALDIVANYQQMEDAKDVLYVDAENSLDVEWARKIGVDVDRMYILHPEEESAEDIFTIICNAVESGETGLWVLDSIGVLLSKQELEKEIDEKTYGGISLPLTRFGKLIVGLMPKYDSTGIAINQLREDMQSQWGGTKTPGGRAWRHYCSVRLEFRRGKFLDEKGNELTRAATSPVGNEVIMSMTKNKTCPPTRRVGQYTINYDFGIDYLKDLVDVAITYEIIDKNGAWFTIIDTDSGEVLADKIQGQANVYAYLEEHEDVLSKVEELVDNRSNLA